MFSSRRKGALDARRVQFFFRIHFCVSVFSVRDVLICTKLQNASKLAKNNRLWSQTMYRTICAENLCSLHNLAVWMGDAVGINYYFEKCVVSIINAFVYSFFLPLSFMHPWSPHHWIRIKLLLNIINLHHRWKTLISLIATFGMLCDIPIRFVTARTQTRAWFANSNG